MQPSWRWVHFPMLPAFGRCHLARLQRANGTAGRRARRHVFDRGRSIDTKSALSRIRTHHRWSSSLLGSHSNRLSISTTTAEAGARALSAAIPTRREWRAFAPTAARSRIPSCARTFGGATACPVTSARRPVYLAARFSIHTIPFDRVKGYDLIDRAIAPDAHTVVFHLRPRLGASGNDLFFLWVSRRSSFCRHTCCRQQMRGVTSADRHPLAQVPFNAAASRRRWTVFVYVAWQHGDSLTYMANPKLLAGKGRR